MSKRVYGSNEPITADMINSFLQECQVTKDSGDSNELMSKDTVMAELNKKVNTSQVIGVGNEIMTKDSVVAELNKKVNTSQVIGVGNEIMTKDMVVAELNKKVNVADIIKLNSNDPNKIMSESKVIYELDKKADKSTGAVNGVNYYLGQVCSAAVSSGTHVFTNCWGGVTVSGNTAKVYVVNSPMLTVNGKTASNWRNICIDGVFSFNSTNKDDIKFFVADFCTSGGASQISTSRRENFSQTRIDAQIINGHYKLNMAVGFASSMQVQSGSSTAYIKMKLDNVVTNGIANRMFYGESGAIETIWGSGEFSLGCAASNLYNKIIKFYVV